MCLVAPPLFGQFYQLFLLGYLKAITYTFFSVYFLTNRFSFVLFFFFLNHLMFLCIACLKKANSFRIFVHIFVIWKMPPPRPRSIGCSAGTNPSRSNPNTPMSERQQMALLIQMTASTGIYSFSMYVIKVFCYINGH